MANLPRCIELDEVVGSLELLIEGVLGQLGSRIRLSSRVITGNHWDKEAGCEHGGQ